MADKKPEKKNEKKTVSYGLGAEDYYDVVEANIARRKAEREKKAEKKKTIPKKPLIIVFVILAVIGGFIFSLSDFFVVDTIEVQGNSFFTAEEVINMAHATPGSNLIYHPDKKSIVNYLKENPYIEDAKVSRKLPSTLVITVKEREQKGAILYDDSYLIVNEQGIRLRKTQTQPKITLISGIKVKKIAIGEVLETENEELFNKALTLLKDMSDNDLYFVRLEMADDDMKAYVYDNLICNGTFEQIDDAITSGHLHKVLKELFAKSITRGTIYFSSDSLSYEPSI
ncbi:MAG: FtsQ-type POTRA domain-containing protein [Mogibacterium sp.]|nr:FtsQ-type POTRA domain-containing protein [Mogibacterium sp.]